MTHPCYRCGYVFEQLGHLNRHLKRRNPCKPWTESKGDLVVPKSDKTIVHGDIEALKKTIRHLYQHVELLTRRFNDLMRRLKEEDDVEDMEAEDGLSEDSTDF